MSNSVTPVTPAGREGVEIMAETKEKSRLFEQENFPGIYPSSVTFGHKKVTDSPKRTPGPANIRQARTQEAYKEFLLRRERELEAFLNDPNIPEAEREARLPEFKALLRECGRVFG